MKETVRKGTWLMVQAGVSFVYKTPLPWVEGKTVYCWFSLA